MPGTPVSDQDSAYSTLPTQLASRTASSEQELTLTESAAVPPDHRLLRGYAFLHLDAASDSPLVAGAAMLYPNVTDAADEVPDLSLQLLGSLSPDSSI